jgi:hypothetical protein
MLWLAPAAFVVAGTLALLIISFQKNTKCVILHRR